MSSKPERLCDRCGSKDVNIFSSFEPIHLKLNQNYMVVEIEELYYQTNKWEKCQFRLCNKCARSFENWFNNYSE